jgi:hypothetical protein
MFKPLDHGMLVFFGSLGCSMTSSGVLKSLVKKTAANVGFGLFSPQQSFYPLVSEHNYGKSPFLMGKLTINGHFQ